MNRFGTGRWYEIPLLALLFLCFFQSLTDFIASVFALGLLQISIPPEVACVMLLFAPLILIPRRKVSARFVVLAGALMLLGRVAGLMLDTRRKMLAAGLSTAAFHLQRRNSEGGRSIERNIPGRVQPWLVRKADPKGH